MSEIKKIEDALRKLNFILSREQKRYGVLIIFMAMIAALFEMVGVSVILPLIQAFLSIDILRQNKYIIFLMEVFHIQSDGQLILYVCIGVIIIYIIKNAYSTFYVWVSSKYTCKIRRELASRILAAYMKQGYIFFVNNNSSRLLRGVNTDIASVYAIVNQMVAILVKIMTIVCITAFIIVSTPALAIPLIVLVIFSFLLTQLLFRKSMQKYGKKVREYINKCYQSAMEAIQGSKEILVTDRQEYFINRYTKYMIGENRSNVRMSVASSAPAYLIEAICISGLLIVLSFQVMVTQNSISLIGQMATIAVAAFRILPSLGALLSSFNLLVYNAPALGGAYDTLNMVKELENNKTSDDKQINKYKNFQFEREVELSHVTFAYSKEQENVISDLSMKIEKGSSIAFIGKSGAGKTTLADLILGLLHPQSGEIRIDGINIEDMGRNWYKLVGYVPQSIYLIDSTIRENVAFGIDEKEIDDQKVWKALEMAQLKEYVEGLANDLNEYVGERGIKFSGGQRQRMAIARALYNDPDILVLDEATAALDTETETAVMESIEAMQGYKTLIIVAHRLSTIRACDYVYEIKNGKAVLKDKNELFY